MKTKDETIKSLEDEIEYLSIKVAKLQAYEFAIESMFNAINEAKQEAPKTITCKYRELKGHSRKRNNGKQCPPGCQVLQTRSTRQWGNGCQQHYYTEQTRKNIK